MDFVGAVGSEESTLDLGRTAPEAPAAPGGV